MVADLDLTNGRLAVASAGHFSPLLLRDGQASFVPVPRSPSLGAGEKIRYQEVDIATRPNDRLVFFTNGLVESRRENLDRGLERLIEMATWLSRIGTLDDLCDELLERVRDPESSDDVAVIALQIA